MSTPDIAIRVRAMSKVYKIYRHPVDLLRELLARGPHHKEHRALDRVSFDVHRGEVLGILGRNGAGKSTLLKILAGTLMPTAGTVEINGRVTAILELGTGFHPDYTGRENIYMGGLCLGMSRKEIASKLDEIIAFSELEDFIDNEFRTYSSGMQARLTFSTAAAVDPDVLIIDEALAVGDAKFQLKCFERISRLRDAGKTILLVTHDENAITQFCDRAVIVEHGTIYADAEPKIIAAMYLHLLFGRSQEAGSHPERLHAGHTQDHAYRRFGNGRASVVKYGLLDPLGNRVVTAQSGKRYTLVMRVCTSVPIDDWSVGFTIKDARGVVVWGLTSVTQKVSPTPLIAGDVLDARVDISMWLTDGDYFVNLGIGHASDGQMIDFIDDAIHFKVTGPGGIFTNSVVNLDSAFRVQIGSEGGAAD